jgi:hypothetical protein
VDEVFFFDKTDRLLVSPRQTTILTSEFFVCCMIHDHVTDYWPVSHRSCVTGRKSCRISVTEVVRADMVAAITRSLGNVRLQIGVKEVYKLQNTE